MLVVTLVPGVFLVPPQSRHLLAVPLPGIFVPGILLPHFTGVSPQMLLPQMVF